ncbi:Cys-tRNA(Pro) deacylase [Wolinella succinogenes]|uniref:Cys-tRNA(Pro) deacylase n=1 Tax=Wolinella succinogenes TaxID=844 RepID=UPI0024097C05|nr:Cys-tRNA(Pro) deacylase [Wolinella succinogenes]
MSQKTNAARILDKKGIAYEIIDYEVDEEDLSAVHVAQTLGMDEEEIYKTLVCVSETGEYLVICLPAPATLDLKALARSAQCKRCELIPTKELLKVTGYIRGGCSPLGMKKHYRTFIDSRAREREYVCVSAGMRGKQIRLAPEKLKEACEAEWVEAGVHQKEKAV